MFPTTIRERANLCRPYRWGILWCGLVLLTMPAWFVSAQLPDYPHRLISGTGPHTAEPANEFFPELPPRDQFIEQQLDKLVTFRFVDESLEGIAQQIRERHTINIIIDQAKLEEESVAKDAKDLTVNLHEIPLRSALKLVLDQKNLTWRIEDSVLKITTRTEGVVNLLTRTYPVRDLVGDKATDFTLLMRAIRKGAVHYAWDDINPGERIRKDRFNSDAGRTISMVSAAGSLVIHQSLEGHAEVLTLLRALRKAKRESHSQ